MDSLELSLSSADQGLGRTHRNIWVDVGDLFEYVRHSHRPSGIQRLAYEIYRCLAYVQIPDLDVRFVRCDEIADGFVAVPWKTVEALFAELTQGDVRRRRSNQASLPVDPEHSGTPLRRSLKAVLASMPPPISEPLREIARAQFQAARQVRVLGSGAYGLAAHRVGLAWKWATGRKRNHLRCRGQLPSGDAFWGRTAPGDILLVLGSPWTISHYSELLRSAQQRYGLQVGVLIYDVLPLRRPEWFAMNLSQLFKAWFESVLPLCDRIFTISEHTARDVDDVVRANGLVVTAPIIPIPVGTGFTATGTLSAQGNSRCPPEPNTYALVVSTIEVRKNHVLLLRVWRRLLEELPADQVPTLVFAGRVGWLVADFILQLRN